MTKKKPTVAKLKKDLDKVFSRFVRLSGKDECYTCGLKRPRLELQCGHFISRQYNATRYDLNNVRNQCVNCNIWRRGNTAFFADNLLRDLGKEEFEALIKRGRSLKQFTVRELEEMIEEFKNKLQDLSTP